MLIVRTFCAKTSNRESDWTLWLNCISHGAGQRYVVLNATPTISSHWCVSLMMKSSVSPCDSRHLFRNDRESVDHTSVGSCAFELDALSSKAGVS